MKFANLRYIVEFVWQSKQKSKILTENLESLAST